MAGKVIRRQQLPATSGQFGAIVVVVDVVVVGVIVVVIVVVVVVVMTGDISGFAKVRLNYDLDRV